MPWMRFIKTHYKLMKFTNQQILLFVALLLGNAIILFIPLNWSWLRWPTALIFTFVLPGLAWLPFLNWMHTSRAVERAVLIFGFSSLLASLALYIAVIVPGPFTETPVFIALNLTTLAGLLAQVIKHNKSSSLSAKPNTQLALQWPPKTILFVLIIIIAVAALTRFTRLGYAEFHEDELENMRLIVRAYKGEEFVPFIDSKGPIHWLLPAALWYSNGWVNEGLARMPMALSALMLVPLMYALGRRMSQDNPAVGLFAAAFVTLNGFYIALAHHVENRALIVFWGALALWFAYRYYKEGINSFLLHTGFTLAIGLIAHPTVLLYLPVVIFIVGVKLYQSQNRSGQWPWLLGGAGLFGAITALFYVPYLLGPDIGLIYQYFAEERVGTAFLYNKVYVMFGEDRLYSTRYHAPVLVLLLVWLFTRQFARLGWPGWLIFGGLGLAIISTLVWPAVWLIGSVNVAFSPYALLTLAILLLPQPSLELKTNVLWFSVPFGVLLFLAQDASNHIQIAYTGFAMLAAFGLQDLWQFLSRPDRTTVLTQVIKVITVVAFILIIPLIVFYQYLLFNAQVTTYWQARTDYVNNLNSSYTTIYGIIPRPRKLISNPRLGGWKAVGYLHETGILPGDFRSINESFAVPIWYTFQTPRSCYTDPQNYWARKNWDGWRAKEQDITAQDYSLTRTVLVDQQPKLHLYEKGSFTGEPEIIDMEDYRQAFDHLATPARFAQAEDIQQATSLNFGDKLLMRGYSLPTTVQPGQLLPVDIYWDTLASMDIRYRGFVHLFDADSNRIAQHDDDPACRLLTTEMRPGQQSARQFRLPIPPETPPGQYTVILGIYHPATFEPLPIWDNMAQQSPGDSFVLGQITVE